MATTRSEAPTHGPLTETLAGRLWALEAQAARAEELVRDDDAGDVAAVRAVRAAAEEALGNSRVLLRALPRVRVPYRPQPGLADLLREAPDRTWLALGLDPRTLSEGRQLLLYHVGHDVLARTGEDVEAVVAVDGEALTLTATTIRPVPSGARRATLVTTRLRAALYGGTAEWETPRRFVLRVPAGGVRA